MAEWCIKRWLILLLLHQSVFASLAASVEPLSEAQKHRMIGVTWHEGCPVALKDLRWVKVPYWGVDAQYHSGALVLHAQVAEQVADLMVALAREHVVIASIEPMVDYGGDDVRSAEANNTSAFNCRAVTGYPGVFSRHSYGKAIDINPLWNPYVKKTVVVPQSGQPFLDRGALPGKQIHSGDKVHQAFMSIGWQWGGQWQSLKDYQHFEWQS